jgi:gamma-carbonic anhydrase
MLRCLEKVALVAGRRAPFILLEGRLFSSTAASSSPAPADTGWLPPEAEFYGNQHQWHDKYCRQRKVLRLGPRFPAIASDAYIAPSAVVVGDVDIADAVRPPLVLRIYDCRMSDHATAWPCRSCTLHESRCALVQVTVMHGSVIRGDLNNIRIGMGSSIQENCVIHAARYAGGHSRCNSHLSHPVVVRAMRPSLRHDSDAITPTYHLRYRNGPTGLPASTVIDSYVTVGAGSLLRSCKVEHAAVVGERSVILEGSVVGSKAVLQAGTIVPPAKLIPAGEVWGGNPARFIRKVTHDEVRFEFALPRFLCTRAVPTVWRRPGV